jgi:hypothetical protein
MLKEQLVQICLLLWQELLFDQRECSQRRGLMLLLLPRMLVHWLLLLCQSLLVVVWLQRM